MSVRALGHTMLAAVASMWSMNAAAGSYTFTTLDQPNQRSNGVAGISDSGEVIGFATPLGVSGGAYTWKAGVFTPVTSSCSTLIAVNARGTIAGTTTAGEQACLLSPKGRTTLLPTPAAVSALRPLAINKNGQIVGYALQANTAYTGYTSTGKTVTLLHPPQSGSRTYLSAISPSGLIAGVASTKNDKSAFAFTYQGGTYRNIDTRDGASAYVGVPSFIMAGGLIGGTVITHPGRFGFNFTQGFSLNGTKFVTYNFPGSASTQLVGASSSGVLFGNYLDSAGHTRGFLFTKGKYVSLNIPGDLGAQIIAANSSGSITGTYFVTDKHNENGLATHSFVGVCASVHATCSQ